MTPVYKLSANSVKNGRTVYGSMLAGNPAYVLPTDFESIATVTGTGSNQILTFSSIPSTFTHLQIRANLMTSGLGQTTTYGGWIVLNSDTASNYTDHTVYGDGASATAYAVVPRANMGIIAYQANPTYSTGNIIDILDYTNTNKFKTLRSFYGGDSNGSGFVALSSGLWRSTSVITSISLYLNAGFGSHNFTTNATASLYGIRSA